MRRDLITLQEAADRLGVHEKTLRRRIASGELTAYRMGPNILRLVADEVDALLVPVVPSGAPLGSPRKGRQYRKQRVPTAAVTTGSRHG